MTRLEIATFCAASVGLQDNITRDQAAQFLALRWKMVWDLRLWKQAQVTHAQTVAAGTQEATLSDTTLDQIIAARWGDSRQLEGIAPDVAWRTDPAAWSETGTLVAYTLRPKDAAGRIVMRFLRAPDTEQELLVLAKRRCPELALDTDAPLISGADQCLIAYTTGDLLRWLRQFSKAQTLFEEGKGHLDQMIQIDEQQSAASQRLVPDGTDFPGTVPWR
jgi:hypothetical protein